MGFNKQNIILHGLHVLDDASFLPLLREISRWEGFFRQATTNYFFLSPKL